MPVFFFMMPAAVVSLLLALDLLRGIIGLERWSDLWACGWQVALGVVMVHVLAIALLAYQVRRLRSWTGTLGLPCWMPLQGEKLLRRVMPAAGAGCGLALLNAVLPWMGGLSGHFLPLALLLLFAALSAGFQTVAFAAEFTSLAASGRIITDARSSGLAGRVRTDRSAEG